MWMLSIMIEYVERKIILDVLQGDKRPMCFVWCLSSTYSGEEELACQKIAFLYPKCS